MRKEKRGGSESSEKGEKGGERVRREGWGEKEGEGKG